MNKLFHTVILLTLSVLMPASPAFAQDEEPTLPSAEETGETVPEEEVSASQEVEITEDNYRQFMELKDPMRQRDVIPENVFKPGSGLQKLEKLPEESQKHLRNQLREIIVKGDPWQPGDEETEYPYTPSAAASTNPALEKQELEAWGELVDSYHDRESRIYENSSGAQAARGSEQGSSNSQQNGAGQPGSASQNSEGSQGQTPGQEGNPDQAAREGTFSLNGSGDPNASNTAGVSQNAMEFLRGNTGQGGTASEGAADSSGGQEGQGENQADQQGQNQSEGQQGDQAEGQEAAAGDGEDTAQEGEQAGDQGNVETDGENNGQAQDAQQTETPGEPASPISPETSDPALPAEPGEDSTAGAAQNALEYLTGEDEQAGEGTDSEADVAQPAGTLTIEDLLNARGVGDSSGMDPAPADPDGEQPPDENIPDKDGDG